MPAEKLKVLALFGTRPELIKLFPVLQRLRRDDRFDVNVVSEPFSERGFDIEEQLDENQAQLDIDEHVTNRLPED